MGRQSEFARVHLRLQYTPPSPAWVTRKPIVGTWLSLVERTLGVGEVASSNLVVPTILFNHLHVVSPQNGSMDSNLVSLTLAVLIHWSGGRALAGQRSSSSRFRPIASASPSFASNDIPIEAEPSQILRRPNYRQVKIHRSHAVEEIACLFGIHKNTVRA